MLGTGTPGADPDRSGPATAVVVNGTPYLVDFGAGVVRRAGAAWLNKGVNALAPQNIKVAFLTHLHSDHTVGYADFVFTPGQSPGRPQPLEVYGPTGLKNMTEHILKAHMLGDPGDERFKANAHEIKPGIVYKDANVTVTAFPVSHGDIEAYGYRFETPDRTIVISGDTNPTQNVIDYCNGCDVLIHEVYSMWTQDQTTPQIQAMRKRLHTSSYELAEIANRAKPKLLVVYHFSPLNGTLLKPVLAMQKGAQQELMRVRQKSEGMLLEEIKKTYKGNVVVGHDLDIF